MKWSQFYTVLRSLYYLTPKLHENVLKDYSKGKLTRISSYMENIVEGLLHTYLLVLWHSDLPSLIVSAAEWPEKHLPPLHYREKWMPAMSLNFQEKHTSSIYINPYGITVLMSFSICLTLPLWLVWFLIFLSWLSRFPQSRRLCEWLSQGACAVGIQSFTPWEPKKLGSRMG